MSLPLTPSNVIELSALYRAYDVQTNREEKLRLQNRMICKLKIIVHGIKAVEELEKVQALMNSLDTKHDAFSQSLQDHIAHKIANQTAIDQKPLVAAERALRKAQRKKVDTRQCFAAE